MIRAALFDMDGLMVDTEPLQSRAFEHIIKRYGKQPIRNESGIVQIPGLRESDNWAHLKHTHAIAEPSDQLAQQRLVVYRRLLAEQVAPQPGLRYILDLLQQHDIRMAVASSSATELIHIVLQKLQIADYFAAVVSGHDVAQGKPAPDIFLLAANQLGVRPEHCIVLEDAESGVRAGKAAGAKVIAIPNTYTTNNDHSAADVVVSSLQAVTWAMIERL